MAAINSEIGAKVVSYLMVKAVEATPPPNKSQAGMAGAVPSADTAPLTGGPHQNPDIARALEPVLNYVNDWDAKLFQQQTSGSMAGIANIQLEAGHGTNGESYEH